MRKGATIRKIAAVVGFMLLGLTVVGYIIPRTMRKSIILKTNIVVADNLNWLFIPLAIFTLIVLTFAFLPVIQSLQHKAKQKQSQITMSYKEGSLRPNDVRAKLETNKSKHPSFTVLLDNCIGQITHIREQQESLAELIRLNDASFLLGSSSTLVKAEQMILRNLMAVINRGIVVKTDGIIDTETERNFEALTKRVLDANNRVLETNQRFLEEASSVISDKGAAAAQTVDNEEWVRVMENQIRLSDLFNNG